MHHPCTHINHVHPISPSTWISCWFKVVGWSLAWAQIGLSWISYLFVTCHKRAIRHIYLLKFLEFMFGGCLENLNAWFLKWFEFYHFWIPCLINSCLEFMDSVWHHFYTSKGCPWLKNNICSMKFIKRENGWFSASNSIMIQLISIIDAILQLNKLSF